MELLEVTSSFDPVYWLNESLSIVQKCFNIHGLNLVIQQWNHLIFGIQDQNVDQTFDQTTKPYHLIRESLLGFKLKIFVIETLKMV